MRKLQCTKCIVLARAVYLSLASIRSFNMFPSVPTHPCFVQRIRVKTSWHNKYRYTVLKRKLLDYPEGLRG